MGNLTHSSTFQPNPDGKITRKRSNKAKSPKLSREENKERFKRLNYQKVKHKNSWVQLSINIIAFLSASKRSI